MIKAPFCIWTESDEKWVCSACKAEVPKSVSPEKPFAACRVGTASLGLEDRQVALAKTIKVYPYATGPGTELKKILKTFGIVPKANCACNDKAMLMNQWGPDGCEDRLEEILMWLLEEAKSRGLPFVKAAAKILVKRAIGNARRAAAAGHENVLPQPANLENN